MAATLTPSCPFAIGAVVLVLFLGFVNMFRGGSPNHVAAAHALARWPSVSHDPAGLAAIWRETAEIR